jgi:hypothetical protein
MSWGTHVFHAGDVPAEEEGAALDAYIQRRTTAAQLHPRTISSGTWSRFRIRQIMVAT